MFRGIRKCSRKSEPEITESDSSDEEPESVSESADSQHLEKSISVSLPAKPVNYRVKGGQLPGVTKSHVLEHRKAHPYCADKFGRIGSVKVDVKELRGGNLIVSDLHDDPVFELLDLGERQSRNVFPAIYHLVMSNGISCLENGKYSAEECEAAIDAFKKLIEASCLKPHKCKKYNVLYGENNIAQTYEFIVYREPDELIEMLEIIEGSLEAGNTSNSRLRKKSIAIIEQLYKTEAITHDDYVELFQRFNKAA